MSTSITSISTRPTSTGVVRSIWWDSNDSYRAEGWFEIGPDMRTAPGAQVTALWADNKHLDLFVTGHDSVVRST